tara:strand:- start:69673 stop:69924 length:252 start_codon:yes stop_codon:yes gene_type:complete
MDLKTTLENKKWAKESLLGSLAKHNLPKTVAKREQLNTEIDEIDKALLILFGVGKSFTAEEIVKELKENETLDDAISFFTNIK